MSQLTCRNCCELDFVLAQITSSVKENTGRAEIEDIMMKWAHRSGAPIYMKQDINRASCTIWWWLELNHIQNSRLHIFDYADAHLEQNLEPFRFQTQAWLLDLIIGKVICCKANYETLVTPGPPFTLLVLSANQRSRLLAADQSEATPMPDWWLIIWD